jgi:hypothetical protein
MEERWRAYVDAFSKRINNGRPADDATALEWMINVNPYRGDTRLRPFWEHIADRSGNEVTIVEQAGSVPRSNRFTCSGGLWTFAFSGSEVRLPDRKGYHDIARLLARPREQLHCTDLMDARTMQKGEEVFDERAKREYRHRIEELQADIEQASAAGDAVRLASLREEYDGIVEHLSRSVGMGGKARKVTGTVEKSRAAVTWRIRSAIKSIDEVHPELGRHLAMSVRTGIFCEYAPEFDIPWEFD